MQSYVDFFCPYVHIFAYCNCLLYSEWHIYCVIILLSHLFWVYHVCAIVCAHMYIYVCIYTCHLHTPLTCILPCILAHNFLRNLKHLSTLTHSFQCWLFTCLCVMLCFNMYTPVPVSVLICYDCECACAEYFFYRIHIFFKRSMLSETPQFAGSFQCSQEAFDATDNAIFLSTLDEPSIFLEVFWYLCCTIACCCTVVQFSVELCVLPILCLYACFIYACTSASTFFIYLVLLHL